jgi:hypothetical protein
MEKNKFVSLSLPPPPLLEKAVVLSGIWMKHVTQPFGHGAGNESQNLLMMTTSSVSGCFYTLLGSSIVG